MIPNVRRRDDYLKRDCPEWLKGRFYRTGALDWFVKSNKTELEKHGAIIKLGREWFVVPEKFESAAAEIFGVRDQVCGGAA